MLDNPGPANLPRCCRTCRWWDGENPAAREAAGVHERACLAAAPQWVRDDMETRLTRWVEAQTVRPGFSIRQDGGDGGPSHWTLPDYGRDCETWDAWIWPDGRVKR